MGRSNLVIALLALMPALGIGQVNPEIKGPGKYALRFPDPGQLTFPHGATAVRDTVDGVAGVVIDWNTAKVEYRVARAIRVIYTDRMTSNTYEITESYLIRLIHL